MARKRTKYDKLRTVFYALVVTFLLVVGFIFFPDVGGGVGRFAMILWVVYSVLGGVLVYLTRKSKFKGALKKYLLLTGISASGFLVSVILHNFFYAIVIITKQATIVYYLAGFLGATFFLLGVIVSPIGFLVGVIGTFVKLKKD